MTEVSNGALAATADDQITRVFARSGDQTTMTKVKAAGFKSILQDNTDGKVADLELMNDCELESSDRREDISGCVFKKLMLSNTHQGGLKFAKCVFRQDVSIPSGSQIEGIVEFEDCQFEGPFVAGAACITELRFSNCTFAGNGDHRPLDLNLHDLSIRGTLTIDRTNVGRLTLPTSHNKTLMFHASNCEIAELAFGGRSGGQVRIGVEIDCDHCLFQEPVHLNSIQFVRPVRFKACRFQKYVDCSRAHLSSVDFYDSVFEQKAYFNDTCFGGRSCRPVANFSEVTFEDGADFERSMFCGETSFRKAVFYEATTFTDIRLYGGDKGEAPDTKKDMLVFSSAQIFGFVGFRKGEKEQEGGAAQPMAGRRELFHKPCCNCVRSDGKRLRVFEYAPEKAIGVDFRNIYISSSRGLRFHSANLEMCKVGGTNLDVCYFNDVRWPRIKINPVHKIYGIYDHEEFLSRRKDSDRDEWSNQCARLSKAYRDLKVAYEQDKDYIYASDFHYAEKHLRRINPQVPRPTKGQLILFWLINGYGERPLRPVALFLLLVLVGTVVYYCDGEGLARPSKEVSRVSAGGEGSVPQGEPTDSRIVVNNGEQPGYPCEKPAQLCWWESVAYSAATAAFLRPDFLVLKEGVSLARVMSWVQTLAGPALFAMFALAIRNKLKR